MDVSHLNCADDALGLAADFQYTFDTDVYAPCVSAEAEIEGSNITRLLPAGGGLPASGHRAQIAFADGLVEQIAFFDRRWTLLAVNRAWMNMERGQTLAGLAPGANYLELCETLASDGDQAAATTAEALRKISAGKIVRFDYLDTEESECSGRVYQIRIYSCGVPGREWRVLARYDVTELMTLKRQKRRLGNQLLNAEADERRRVARDLHDTTAQDLCALQISLANLKRGPRSPSLDKFADADEALDRLQREIRSISYLFHSPLPDQPSLSKALGSMARGFGQRTGLNVNLDLDDADVADPKLSMAMHRLTQEALANVHRHAKATEVDIKLIATERRLHLMIRDNGIGFAAGAGAQTGVGVGLRSMRERVEEFGGCLLLKSGKNGTSVIASIPLDGE